MLLVVFAAPAAWANSPPVVVIANDYSICPAYSGFVYKIVTCIKDVILWAMLKYLTPFMTYAANMIGAFITLAAVFTGFLIATGRVQNFSRDGLAFFVKAGIVSVFALNFGNIAATIFNIMDWLLNAMAIATFYSSPMCPIVSNNMWVRVDCLLEMIIGGFLPGGSLYNGVMGFIITCLVSGPFGLFFGIMGFIMIGCLVLGIAQCAYTFVMSCISIAFMICVAPIFVPMLMLEVTRGYFEKWLRLTLGLIIQPAVLFAYMAMLLLAFDVVMYTGPSSIYAAVTGAPATPGTSPPLGAWLATSGAYADKTVSAMTQTVGPASLFQRDATGKPMFPGSLQTGIFSNMPLWSNNLNLGNVSLQQRLEAIQNAQNNSYPVHLRIRAVSFEAMAGFVGMNLYDYYIKLFGAFFLAATVAYILLTLLRHVPYISNSLAGEFMSTQFVGPLLSQINPLKKIDINALKKDFGDTTIANVQDQFRGGK